MHDGKKPRMTENGNSNLIIGQEIKGKVWTQIFIKSSKNNRKLFVLSQRKLNGLSISERKLHVLPKMTKI